MRTTILTLLVWISLTSCNPWTIEYPLIYTNEAPNDEFAQNLKELLEDTYNVEIRLVQAENVNAIVDSLTNGDLDMAFLENFVNEGKDINTVIPIFPKVLHLFYKEELKPESFEDLFLDKMAYVGPKGSASYKFMMELFEFYSLDSDRIQITFDMNSAEVQAVFRVIMTQQELTEFEGYQLFSMDKVEAVNQGSIVDAISLQYPRVRPFIIPIKTYGDLTTKPVVTIATDMMFVVREGMTWLSINDLINTLFAHRERFVHVHPAFHYGIIEDFDRSKLSYPLHEGARSFLDRDEPSFFERYAELVGVTFTILVALVSGLISYSNQRKHKKKDKIDIFYAHLMKIKNEMPTLRTSEQVREKLREIREQKDKAFKMLIEEELEANESFRIYMELAKETIGELGARLKSLGNQGK